MMKIFVTNVGLIGSVTTGTKLGGSALIVDAVLVDCLINLSWTLDWSDPLLDPKEPVASNFKVLLVGQELKVVLREPKPR